MDERVLSRLAVIETKIEDGFKSVSEIKKDHEDRIRSLEYSKAKLFAWVGIAATIIPLGISKIFDKIFH